jgi:indolepyruvate ferredoxin oxidoreductase alpha subunit
MERSFAAESALLRLGRGDVFRGEGIVAVAKGLLQSGVSYVGGYQGAPVSHLMVVFADAHDVLDELGVEFESSPNEAAAAARLSASINYPVRGAAVWKSPVGTNVASDALSNLASAGVMGGALIVLGEDYGEGSSAIQERTHAFAMKSQIWLLDPRPDLASVVRLIEHGFALSEFSSSPVMIELRVRLCHLHGEFVCSDNTRPPHSRSRPIAVSHFEYANVTMPPSTYAQERQKIDSRWPRALEYIRRHRLNETFAGDLDDVGLIVQGGLYNGVVSALFALGLGAEDGGTRIPIHALNVTYPLVGDEIARFCEGKRTVLVVEEGQPNFIESAVSMILRQAGSQTILLGKDTLPATGEYTGEVLLSGLARFLEKARPRTLDIAAVGQRSARLLSAKTRAAELLGGPVPARPPTFCTGCPERPVFSALKIIEQETSRLHVCADIGCHTFSVLPPFNLGNSIMGYGLGLASSTALAPMFGKRVVSIMGDGGFWHNGLTSGVIGGASQQTEGVLVIMKNGYTSAPGAQHIPSTSVVGASVRLSIERTLKSVGIRWMRRVRTYDVGRMVRTLRKALDTPTRGLKVIVAEGECQLERQRRIRPANAARIARGGRVVVARYGVDDALCTGDHSCIRLSGCPSLTIKPSPDPLRLDPVATVNADCVGCGVCGEVAHAAVLCPSFHRVEVVRNAGRVERLLQSIRDRLIARLAGRSQAA